MYNSVSERRQYRKISDDLRRVIIDRCVVNGTMRKSEAARIYNLPRSTVSKIVETYVGEGRVTPLPRGGRRETCVKLREEVHGEFICNFLDEDCTRTLGMLKEALLARFPDLAERGGLAISTIWEFVVKKVGFTLKRTIPVEERRNTQEQLLNRQRYAMNIMMDERIRYRLNCIFIDEAGFNANLIRGEGWSKKGHDSIVTTRYKRAMNVTIIAAISYNGVVNISAKSLPGGTTGEIFREYLKLIIDQLDGSNAGPCYFIMDNAPIHKAGVVKELFTNSVHQLLYLPGYSPFLNPVEECFSKLKTLVKRKPGITQNELLDHIRDAANRITVENCRAWVEHSYSYFEDCLQSKPILH